MTLSPGPPPWPIPPSWTLTPPQRGAEPTESRPLRQETTAAPAPVESAVPRRTITLLAPDDAEARDVLGSVPGVTVDVRTLPAPGPGFAGVYTLADAAARAFSEGAEGVVIVHGGDTPDETAWALDLLHPGDAPLVLAAAPGRAADVADAISVAAAVPPRSGCLVLTHGEIHAARYVRRTGTSTPVLSSAGAGPLGHVTAGAVRLQWRPPERLTLRGGPAGGRMPRVGLHTTVLGDDGELLGALAERCDGLVVTATAAGDVPDTVAGSLAAVAARIPVVLASPVPHASLTATSLDPFKARVLMHLLLAAGRERDMVLSAFAAAERPGPVQL